MPEVEAALAVESAIIGYRDKAVFDNLSLDITGGCITGFCGPNGCGKSTALKAIRRILPVTGGEIRLMDRALPMWPAKDLARELAMLSQSPEAPHELTVRDLIGLGRYAHRSAFSGLGPADRSAIETALSATSVDHLADRAIGSLSGGQLQRAWIAMILAQEAPIILLDEPTNHLDVAHALETLNLVRRLCDEEGKTVVTVLHDLNMAARFCDEIVFFRDGVVHERGGVSEVFRTDVIETVFGIACEIRPDGPGNRPYFLAHGSLADNGEQSPDRQPSA